MNSTREFVIERLSTLLDIPKDEKICTDLEKCILNHSYDRCKSQAAWDNPDFSSIYKHKFLSLQKSIRSNPNLVNKIKSKLITVLELVNMRPEALQPDGPYAKRLRWEFINNYERNT